MATSTSARILALIVLIVLASCSAPTSLNEKCPAGAVCEPALPADVATARATWTANRPASYDYTLALSCFCGHEVRRPVLIAVTGTTVMSRTYADDGSPYPAQFAASFPSIDGLFDLLVDAKARNAARADVTYNPTLGYPVQISLDYRTQVADDELFYTVSAFRAR